MKTNASVFTVIVVGLAAVNLHAAEGSNALVEASLLPEGDLTLKQRCELVVRFLSDGVAFARAPQFPPVEIPEAIVVPPRSGLNITERRGGDTWIGVQRSYAVFPRKAGLLEVPAITVTGRVRSGSSVTEVAATSEPFQHEVVVPDGFSGHPDIVVTLNLRLEQRLEPQPTEFKVGDSFKRAITVTASDTVSMLLPVVKWPEIEGMSVYPEQATLDDRDQRGVISASRVDSATYIMEREGEYRLPELSVHWWDPRSREVQVATAPELEFRVVPNPDLVQAAVAPDDSDTTAGTKTSGRPAKVVLLILLAVAAFAIALWWVNRKYGVSVRTRFATWRERRAESEASYFKRFRRACKSGNARDTMQALWSWLDHRTDFSGAPTLIEFCRKVGDPDLEREIANLNSMLFGASRSPAPATEWSGAALLKLVTRARRRLRHASAIQTRPGRELQPLNPGTVK